MPERNTFASPEGIPTCAIIWPMGIRGKNGFWDRLSEAMEANRIKVTQKNAGALAGVNQTSARKWQYGELPSMTNALEIAQNTGFNVEWLLTGRGEKRPGQSTVNEAHANYVKTPTDRTLKFANKFEHLPETLKVVLERYLDQFVKMTELDNDELLRLMFSEHGSERFNDHQRQMIDYTMNIMDEMSGETSKEK